ncbi:MAG: AMP-binding protein [Firmicutes bacterium]|nr:AMP-binding protein [Bacillota bacterium]
MSRFADVENFYTLFARVATRHAARPAVFVQHAASAVEVTSYAELQHLAERAAACLARLGVAAGDRCAILAGNHARWCAAYLGTLRLGAIAVPLDTAYQPAQLATLLRDCGARVLFTSARYLSVARSAAPAGIRLVLLEADSAAAPDLESAWEEVGIRPAPASPPVRRADPAVILYTSGTTSDPKGVVLTHGNLLAEIEAVLEILPVDERDCVLGVLPLFHALAQMANLLLPFSIGASVVYLETLNTTELLRALAERGATAFACVPQFFYLIHQRILQEAKRSRLRHRGFRALLAASGLLRHAGINVGPWLFAPVHRLFGRRMRWLVTGGSRFDPAVAADFWRMGVDILQAYGLTETSGAATLTRPGDRSLGSCGTPLPGCEVRILPREPSEAADPETRDGEIAIRGPIVMAGYYNRPEATAAVFREGWFVSGDLGYLDTQGRLFITGRKKELIVTSSGKNIYPEEIEAHYQQCEYIRELCVVGIARPGEPAAERLHAVIVPDLDRLRARKVLNLKEVLRWEIEGLSAQLPPQKRILSYEIWTEELPRTTTRKLKRFEIERRVRAATARAAHAETATAHEDDPAWLADPHVARALSAVRRHVRQPDAVRGTANLELDLGLDSMERVELFAQLELEFGVRLSEEVTHTLYTVRDLVEALRPTAARATAAPTTDPWSRRFAEVTEDDPALAGLRRPSRVRAALLFPVAKFLYLFFRLFLRLRVTGREHLHAALARLRTQGLLLCPNHQSYLDPFALVAALPFRVFRRLFFVGASEYFSGPLTRRLARLINLIPVDPDTNLLRAMQAGAYGLRHGKILVLFPEGERSIDGTVRRFKKGAAILALHTRSAIVPVAIDGAFERWPRTRGPQWSRWLPWRGQRLRLHFGPALNPPPPLPESASLPEAEAHYAAYTETLRRTVEAHWQTLHAMAGHAEH